MATSLPYKLAWMLIVNVPTYANYTVTYSQKSNSVDASLLHIQECLDAL